jgi:hypothetical protein
MRPDPRTHPCTMFVIHTITDAIARRVCLDCGRTERGRMIHVRDQVDPCASA